ncbi:hsp70-binding protein 1 [Toxorhynchites rutilus septentrionalis]|uniref:hsp70-binding protein 1 n=1 Tax=Toxorhynchites rutilus septentrionalis TaxID=329112 RepID=UPI002478339D|nr:hsp70-binding protein 1 [Toxorhynchites rutilus septentrionalis]
MASGGENPDQPRQPRDLQGLLKFAMETTKSEDAPNPSQFQQMDEERRRFLEEAINSFTVDVVKRMEESMTVIMDPKAQESDKVTAIEEITDFIQDINAADDFCKVGGLVIVPPGLNSPSADIRVATLGLVAGLSQNNPYSQQKLLEANIMPRLVELLSDEDQVAAKAMYAISCMVRNNANCMEAFADMGGKECIIGCIQSENTQLRVKSVFLMAAMCQADSAVRDEFILLNAVENVAASIKPTSGYNQKLEISLMALDLLALCDEGVHRCQNEDLNLKSKLESILKLDDGSEECAEIRENTNFILKRCFTSVNGCTDR